MKLQLNCNKTKHICSRYISLAISDRKLFDVYCCRAYNNLDKRIDYNWVIENIDGYLEKTVDSKFIVNERYPKGYCLKNQNDIICNELIEPYKMITGVSLGIMTKCNYQCPYCAQRKNKKSGLTIEEELDLTCKIIKGLAKYEYIKDLQISNAGELSIYNTEKLANTIINNRNIKTVSILTNGSNSISINQFTEQLCKHNIRCTLNVSFYSLNKDTYKQLTGSDNLENVLKNINNYKNAFIIINYILFKENINELDDIIDYCKSKNLHLYIAPNMWDEEMHKKLLELKYLKSNMISLEGDSTI